MERFSSIPLPRLHQFIAGKPRAGTRASALSAFERTGAKDVQRGFGGVVSTPPHERVFAGGAGFVYASEREVNLLGEMTHLGLSRGDLDGDESTRFLGAFVDVEDPGVGCLDVLEKASLFKPVGSVAGNGVTGGDENPAAADVGLTNFQERADTFNHVWNPCLVLVLPYQPLIVGEPERLRKWSWLIGP